jgi:NTE family protein
LDWRDFLPFTADHQNQLDMKTGLVLSGGGAVVAVLYAGGIAPARIREIVKESSYFGFSHLLLGKPGLFTMEALRRILAENLPGTCFEDLPVRVFVTAMDLSAGRSETFSTGNLTEPVLASACLPDVYEPVRIGDSEYVDGGVLDNFPIEPLLPLCDVIIGSHVNRIAAWAAGRFVTSYWAKMILSSRNKITFILSMYGNKFSKE